MSETEWESPPRMPPHTLARDLEPLAWRLLRETALGDSRRMQWAAHSLLRRWGRVTLPVWYHPDYRLPLSSFERVARGEPRRADFVAWYLADCGLIAPASFRTPERVSYRDLSRVHTEALLDGMHSADALARVFASSPAEIVIDEVLRSVRLACGGTLAAARAALASRGPALNLSGGFHHAEPDRAGGYCPFNDLAVAVAVLRAEGFTGRVVVIDLDAHPPDGTAACLRDDPNAWIGSLSGADWGPLPGNVVETVLPHRADDAVYRRALVSLLARVPRPVDLAFVLAGGDVLAGDHHGGVALTLEGARERDERVFRALAGVPSVWLPAGGYHPDAWRVLAGTALVLAGSPLARVPPRYDPLNRQFSRVARTLRREDLRGDDPLEISFEDLADDLHLPVRRRRRLLDYYTAEGIELVLDRYGVLEQLRRLSYQDFRVDLDAGNPGDRARIYGRANGTEHLLVELVVEKRVIAGSDVLYVHWLTLQHPLARFDALRPRLPGQQVPGLGLARESVELLKRMALRLGLAGVAFTPSHYHMAFVARKQGRFISPERQGRFEALVRDLAGLSLLEATTAVAEGRVRLNSAPYAWEATEMVLWHDPAAVSEAAVAAAREEAARCRFSVEPRDRGDAETTSGRVTAAPRR